MCIYVRVGSVHGAIVTWRHQVVIGRVVVVVVHERVQGVVRRGAQGACVRGRTREQRAVRICEQSAANCRQTVRGSANSH